MFFSYLKNFISKFIIVLLGVGLVVSLGVGTDIISFGMSDKIVAKINDKDITIEEFNYFRRLRFADASKKLLSDKEAVKIIDKQIVNTIARRKVSSEQAAQLGLYVSDDEIEDKIKGSSLFSNQGRFIGFSGYKAKVKDIFGLKIEVFEQILREEVLTDKLESFFSSFVFVSDLEIEQKYRDDSTKLNFYTLRANSSQYEAPNFTDIDINNFIMSKKEEAPISNLTYILAQLDFEELTKDINITKKDIDSFILNYSSDDESISDESAKTLIRKRIALNLLPKKFKSLNEMAESKSFDEIISENGIKNKVISLNLDTPQRIISKDLLSKIVSTNFSDRKVQVFISIDSLWIVTTLGEKILSKQEALASLRANSLHNYQMDLLTLLLDDDKSNDRLVFDSTKSDIKYSYEFNYDLSFADFSKVTNSKIGYPVIKEGHFVPRVISAGSENFIVFIEKVRKADTDFLLLDKDKIKKDLSRPRKEKIYRTFLTEIFTNSNIKYNPKYIN
ncbi:SurA N-terminal domain-containing protein [bacterium]|nr:SurA N-terminal domain-containing protein [bacterium]